MINVFSAVKKYGLETPFIEAAGELATHAETGTFMKRGEYALVEIGPKYVYPTVKLNFTSALKVTVLAGNDFAIFKHGDVTHVFWRVDALPNNSDAA